MGGIKGSKQAAGLARRQKNYDGPGEDGIAGQPSWNQKKAMNAVHRPGSNKKNAPKGRM